jgi:hypothetical protein
MEFSSDAVIEFSCPKCWPNAGVCPGRACSRDSGGTEIALRDPGRKRGIQIPGIRLVLEPRRRQTTPSPRAQRAIQSDRGVTSDLKRAEEVLERTRMALSERNCRFEDHSADEATWAVVWERRQNRDGIDRWRNYLDTGTYGRSEIYGSVRLVEGGFGQVWPRYDGCADCGSQEEQN